MESSWKIDSDELIRRAPAGGSLDSGELRSNYIGINYYYSKAVTFMAGYEDAESIGLKGNLNKEYTMDGLRARVQVLW